MDIPRFGISKKLIDERFISTFEKEGLVARIIAPSALLMAVNLYVFWSHYAGSMAFPWDFLGGYHAQSFAWYRDGSFFDPPKWLPWSDAGFPAYWALQSGAFYIPVQFMDWLGLPYSIVNAVRLQSFHVFIGSLGLFVLLRSFRFPTLLALAGALGYQMSVGFYSNQQHVDIIRAYALFPWLFWLFSSHVILKNPLYVILATFVLFQFLIGAYPGAVVSAAYTIATATAVFIISKYNRPDARYVSSPCFFLIIIALSALAACLMSFLKWLPPVIEGDWVSGQNGVQITPFSVITTLVYPYDVSFLPLDVTMRSLWLPIPMVLGILFIRNWTVPATLGTSLTILALFALFTPPVLHGMLLPGFNVSRFPVADWRPVLHLGLILASCVGWHDRLTDSRLVCWRDALVLVCLVAIVDSGLNQGFGLDDASIVLAFGLLPLLSVFVASRFGPKETFFFASLIAIITVQGVFYQTDQGRVWNLPWNAATENAVFGPNFEGFARSSGDEPLTVDRRPRRLTVGTTYEDILEQSLSSRYNTCSYQQTFCLLGYNNIRLSRPNQKMLDAIRDPNTGPILVDFLTQEQSLLAFPLETRISFDDLDGRRQTGISRKDGAMSYEVKRFASDEVRYHVTTARPMRFVENEIWASGWTGEICEEDGNDCRTLKIDSVEGFLRSWIVPEGDWNVTITFDVQSMRWAWFSFVSGMMIAILASLLVKYRRKGEAVEAKFS